MSNSPHARFALVLLLAASPACVPAGAGPGGGALDESLDAGLGADAGSKPHPDASIVHHGDSGAGARDAATDPEPDGGNTVAPSCAPPDPMPDPSASTAYQAGFIEYSAGTTSIPTSGMGSPNPIVARRSGVAYYPATQAGTNAPIVAQGRFPLVVIIHGHHPVYRMNGQMVDCANTSPDPIADYVASHPAVEEIASYHGYDYLAANLAASGRVVVSINANDLHCWDNALIVERTELVFRTVAMMKAADEGSDSTVGALGDLFRDRLDLSSVVLIGHSRGGEAVLDAAQRYQVAGTTLKGVIAIAPSGFLVPDLRIENVPLLFILPSADGDVTYNMGAPIYDVATSDDSVPGWFKAQQYLFGGNHNFFNTEWNDPIPESQTGDNGVGNGSGRLTPEQERSYNKTITRVFLGALDGDAGMRQVLAGTAALDPAPAAAWPSYTDRGTYFTPANAPESSGFSLFGVYDFTLGQGQTFNDTFYHWTRGFVGVWEQPSAALWSAMPSSGTAPTYVSLRVAQVVDNHNAPGRSMAIDVELEDRAGNVASVGSDWAGALIPPYYQRPPEPNLPGMPGRQLEKTMLGTVRIPAGCFAAANPALSWSTLATIRVRTREDRGALAITDFQWIP